MEKVVPAGGSTRPGRPDASATSAADGAGVEVWRVVPGLAQPGADPGAAPPARRKVLYVCHWLSSTLCSTVQRSGARRMFTGRPNFVRVVAVQLSKRSNEHAFVVEQFAVV